jgi:hypothetical protein
VALNPIKDVCKNGSFRRKKPGTKLQKISIYLFKNSKKITVYLMIRLNAFNLCFSKLLLAYLTMQYLRVVVFFSGSCLLQYPHSTQPDTERESIQGLLRIQTVLLLRIQSACNCHCRRHSGRIYLYHRQYT